MSEAQEIQPISPDDVAPLLPMSEVIDTINKAILTEWDGSEASIILNVSLSQAQLDEVCEKFRAVGWKVFASTSRCIVFTRG